MHHDSKFYIKDDCFLSTFDIDDDDLSMFEKDELDDNIILKAEKDGKFYLIKFWPKKKNVIYNDLELFWHQEMRLLNRLNGLAESGNYIPKLSISFQDEYGFYLVLDTQERLPLSEILSDSRLSLKRHWIKRISNNFSYRIIFWKNILRLVKAIGLLHSQGILHRNIDTKSILIAYDNDNSDNEFQLTGFEWSIRLLNLINNQNDVIDEKTTHSYSFIHDWIALGRLICQLLHIDLNKIGDLSLTKSIVLDKTRLTILEINLIRVLLNKIPTHSTNNFTFLEARIIEDNIQKIINSLKDLVKDSSSTYNLALHFGYKYENKGSNKIRAYSLYDAIAEQYLKKYDIRIDENDIDKLEDFIKVDLSDSPYLLFWEKDGLQNLYLKGTELIYKIEKFKINPQSPESTWDIGCCKLAYFNFPFAVKDDTTFFSMKKEQIKLFLIQEARRYYFNDKSKLSDVSWSEMIAQFEVKDRNYCDEHQLFVKSLVACHLTNIAFVVAESFPVYICNIEIDNNGHNRITMKCSLNEHLEKLSKSLKLRAPSVRLNEILKDYDSLDNDIVHWNLMEEISFNKELNEYPIKYIKWFQNENKEILYVFSSEYKPASKNYYLVSNSVNGSIQQLKRHSKILDIINQHNELVENLTKPEIKHSYDNYDKNILKTLDISKQNAFDKIMKTLPLNLVQGPPGVGKTFLVTALVKQIFDKSSSSRILLTAQSHDTVQHLSYEIKKLFQENSFPPLIFECNKSSLKKDLPHQNELDFQAKYYLSQFTKSKIFNDSQCNKQKKEIFSCLSSSNSYDRYPIINLLINSANIVFSTTNSDYVARMIKDRAQFDWTITEETGKATGLELVSPLLLSHRRLMIGDHKQLPPYKSTEIKTILSNPNLLSNAIKEARRISSHDVIGETVKDFLIDLDDNNILLDDIGREAAKNLMLFESLVTEEERQNKLYYEKFGQNKQNSFFSTLDFQYRMHPHIAEIVSKTFYNNKLLSDKKVTETFLNQRSNVYLSTLSEPDNLSPIIWINTPDIQRVRSKSGDKPSWSNSYESKLVVEVLKQLEINNISSPTLAILSPYSEQINSISKRIVKEKNKNDKFNHIIDKFNYPNGHSNFCNTVDSFQGSEADIVIVSLVRNNSRGAPKSALGFLLDQRRINVLLSRARYKLIVIGCYDFLKDWSENIAKRHNLSNYSEQEFLVKLMENIAIAIAEEKIVLISSDRIYIREKIK